MKKHEEKQLVVENAVESSNLGECIELVVAVTLGNYWIPYKPFFKQRQNCLCFRKQPSIVKLNI